MSHYIDVLILPDPEFPTHQLMAALYAKLHRALASEGTTRLAVSFPSLQETPLQLGRKLRLLGTPSDLDALMAVDWLRGMRDHVAVGSQLAVPALAGFRTLRRVQAKSSPERLRRRLMRRHSITAEDAHQRLPDSVGERLRLPFLDLASASTGQRFRLFLRLGPSLPHAIAGDFNSFGLSQTATIPCF